MKDKKVLITGAGKGIGFEIASQLGSKGFHVIISGRNETGLLHALKILEKKGVSVEMVLLDIESDESVKNAAAVLAVKKTKIDVIINNAAVALKRDESILFSDFKILESTININSFGAVRVVKAFLPMMNRPGKIINISSEVGSMSGHLDRWSPSYGVSKTLLNALTRHMAHELQNEHITVNAVCPGWVRTDMGGQFAPRTVEQGAETPVWLVIEASPSLTGKIFSNKREIDW